MNEVFDVVCTVLITTLAVEMVGIFVFVLYHCCLGFKVLKAFLIGALYLRHGF